MSKDKTDEGATSTHWWLLWSSFNGLKASPRLIEGGPLAPRQYYESGRALSKHRLTADDVRLWQTGVLRLNDLARFYPPPPLPPAEGRATVGKEDFSRVLVLRALRKRKKAVEAAIKKGTTEISKENGDGSIWKGLSYTGEARIAVQTLKVLEEMEAEVLATTV